MCGMGGAILGIFLKCAYTIVVVALPFILYYGWIDQDKVSFYLGILIATGIAFLQISKMLKERNI